MKIMPSPSAKGLSAPEDETRVRKLAPSTTDSAEPVTDRLRVFISYARRDGSDFTEYLVAALKQAGFDAFLDRHDIARGEAWETRINALIAGVDTILFVITPGSVASKRCEDEVTAAVRHGKRLVPVQWIAVPEEQVPGAIKRLNYTVFVSGQPFSGPFADLAEALRQDLGWLRQKTDLDESATRWEGSKRNDDLLLRGVTLTSARRWLDRRKADAPLPSPALIALIGASEDGERRRQDAEQVRLKEREHLVAEAERSSHLARRRRIAIFSILVAATVFFSVLAAMLYRLAQSEGIARRDVVRAATISSVTASKMLEEQGARPYPAVPSKSILTVIREARELVAQDFSGMRIVWFDPNPQDMGQISQFKGLGFDLVMATQLEQAAELIQLKTDVIISHFGLNGPQKEASNAYRLKAIRDSGPNRGAPIVIYTRSLTREHICTSQADGFFDSVEDPFRLVEYVLLAALKRPRVDRCGDR